VPRNFVFDANGSTSNDGLNTYTYDARGRMMLAVSTAGTTSYQVNALGQRIRKTLPTDDRIFVYDRQGKLVAEHRPPGALLTEYVYLGDIPVGIVAAAGLNYVQADHLNTPRLVANSTSTAVWKWDQQEPFGVNTPNENPSSLGAFEFSLRFPGQYADKETNLVYNMARDYDSAIGAYKESDPIGLRGGVNTYSHVNGNPISYTDPLGLDVNVCYYPGGVGHVGAGVNSTATTGLYAQNRGIGALQGICTAGTLLRETTVSTS
jgi:RHS repeat-associated protein